MRTFVKAATPSSATALEARWYLSEEVFQLERERVFGRAWTCVGRREQLARSGDFFLADVAGESLICVRDLADRIHAFYNVCRHRGTRLCAAAAGSFKGSIQCPYHAWTYALEGSLIAARETDEVAGFDRSCYGLRPAALAELDGFLYLNLDPDAEPLATAFAPLAGRFARWRLADLRTAGRIEYELRCNWKLVFQNYSECYHCPVIHPQLEKLSAWDSGRNDLVAGPFLGGYSTLRDGDAGLTTSGRRARAPIGSLGGEELSRAYYYTIFPSLLLSLHADYAMAHYVQPLAVDRTRVVCEWLFEPEAIVQSGFDPSDAVEFWDATNRQDWRINELTQLGIASRAYVPGPYLQSEGLLHAFDRHYRSVMEADRR